MIRMLFRLLALFGLFGAGFLAVIFLIVKIITL